MCTSKPRVAARRRVRLVRALMMGVCLAGAVFSCSGLLTDASVRAQGRRYRQVGRQDDGSIVVTINQTLMSAGRQVEFRGRPLAVALSPDGRTAAFLNGTYQAIILARSPRGR